jgi:hypothetical protein
VVGGILGGVLTGRPGGVAAGAIVGGATGAAIGPQAEQRHGYLSVAGRLLLPISMRSIRRCRSSLLQLNGAASVGITSHNGAAGPT